MTAQDSMSWRDHRRSNLSVQAILNIVEEEGLSATACLDGTGLKPSDVLNAETKIEDDVEIKITQRALRMLPDKAGYGIRTGQALRVTTFGIWGLAILASPKFRDSFETITRFAELSFLLSKIRLEEQGDEARIVVDMHKLPEKIHRFMFERYYAGSVTFLREMMPELNLSRFQLHLPFVDGKYTSELATITGRDIVEGLPHFAMVTDRNWLDQPLPQADPLAHAHFVSQCQSLLNQHKKLPDHAQLIRDHIVQKNQYSPRLGDVAAEAGLSPRSFRRRLADEDTSFKQIVLETKMSLAKELLSTAGLAVNIVAYKLGYAETASFSRAYSQFWGETPSRVRKAAQS